MSKVLTDKEVTEIVSHAVSKPTDVQWKRGLPNTCDAYESFLKGIGNLIADCFGGDFVNLADIEGEDGFEPTLLFKWNRHVPENGGVYADYDIDLSIDEWRAEATIGLGNLLIAGE